MLRSEIFTRAGKNPDTERGCCCTACLGLGLASRRVLVGGCWLKQFLVSTLVVGTRLPLACAAVVVAMAEVTVGADCAGIGASLKEGYRRAGILYRHVFASESDANCRRMHMAVDPPQTMFFL